MTRKHTPRRFGRQDQLALRSPVARAIVAANYSERAALREAA